jgi:hypothetical protein
MAFESGVKEIILLIDCYLLTNSKPKERERSLFRSCAKLTQLFKQNAQQEWQAIELNNEVANRTDVRCSSSSRCEVNVLAQLTGCLLIAIMIKSMKFLTMYAIKYNQYL